MLHYPVNNAVAMLPGCARSAVLNPAEPNHAGIVVTGNQTVFGM